MGKSGATIPDPHIIVIRRRRDVNCGPATYKKTISNIHAARRILLNTIGEPFLLDFMLTSVSWSPKVKWSSLSTVSKKLLHLHNGRRVSWSKQDLAPRSLPSLPLQEPRSLPLLFPPHKVRKFVASASFFNSPFFWGKNLDHVWRGTRSFLADQSKFPLPYSLVTEEIFLFSTLLGFKSSFKVFVCPHI